MASAPIADLRYRGYDGDLAPANRRWWVIAQMGLRQAMRKKAYWILTAFAGWYYLALFAVVYFAEQLGSFAPEGAPELDFVSRFIWKDQFLHGIGFGQIIWLAVLLVAGAGAIANDNRTNALLVYLSKPCNKGDYLFGKWMGVFLPLLISMALPSLVFYLYGLMNYGEYGFFSDDPWLIARLAVLFPLLAAFHTSLMIGISSIFRQGRLAGATYAGVFFISLFFAKFAQFAWLILTDENAERVFEINLLSEIFYASPTSFQVGISKLILGTDGSVYFGIPSEASQVPAPQAWWVVIAFLLLVGASLLLAWRRIRAVEVVQ